MRFVKTTIKNILSFGGDKEFSFDYDIKSFNLVFGDNGVGKTNFTKLIEIGIYFEYPESVSDVKNKFAEEGFIEHTVESNNHIWVIKSMFRKNLKKITVHKDGELQDWGNPSTVQNKIAEHIIDIPFSIFKNVLCSSMENVSSVLKMNAKESKDITNQIFDLSEINDVGEHTSKYHYSKGKALSEKKVEKETLDNSLNEQELLFEEFKKRDEEDTKVKLEAFEKELEQSKTDLERLKLTRDSLLSDIASINKSIFEKEKKDLDDQTAILTGENSKKDIEKTGFDAKLKSLRRINETKTILFLIDSVATFSKQKSNYSINLQQKQTAQELLQRDVDTGIANINKEKEYKEFRAKLEVAIATTDYIKDILTPDIKKHSEQATANISKQEELIAQFNEATTEIAILKPEIAFLENPKCYVEGCNTDFSSPENQEKLKIKRDRSKFLEEEKIRLSNAKDVLIKEHRDIVTANDMLKGVRNIKINELKNFDKTNQWEYPIMFSDGVDIKDFEEKCKFENTEEYLTLHQTYVKKLAEDAVTIKKLEDDIRSNDNNLASSKNILKNTHSILEEQYKDYDTEANRELIKTFKAEHITEAENSYKVLSDAISANEKIINENNVKSQFKSKQITELGENIVSVEYTTAEEMLKTLNDKKASKTEIDTVIKGVDESIIITQTNIDNLKEDTDKSKFEVFERSIQTYKDSIKTADSQLRELNEDFKSAEILKELYNNGWLKNELIGQVVGGINSIISQICDKYDIPVRCEFNSAFNATMYKNGVETKYGQCSLGQRKMLQLISIIAIVSYYKQTYPKINFIFLDEALSSLTEVNVNKMVVLINEYLVDKLGMTVYISHHSFLKGSYFSSIYELLETNSYTEIFHKPNV